MGPDLELKSKSENTDATAFSGQKVLEPGTNYIGEACGVETMPIEQPPLFSGNEDVEVNITGCTNPGKALVVEDSCDNATECSSSFGNTGSGRENAPSFSDTEVESRLYADDASSSMFDDCCESLQRSKKRVTSHWRKFIRPLMWHCKWTELQLKQLQSQARKYDKELAAYNCTKRLDFAHLTLDGSNIKSVPISGRMHRNKIMKRNKRNRVEEKCDLASYMCNHSLFSYYEQTDCTVDACFKDFHGVAIGGNIDDNEFKLDDLWTYVDYENVDKSLNDIIQKIEAVHSQVHSLKSRMEKVISENSERFDSVTRLNMPGPCDGFNHAELNSAPCPNEENMFPVSFVHSPSQLELEYYMGDLPMPGNESLIQTTDRPELEDLCEDAEDGALIQNRAAEEELHDFGNDGIHLLEETKESIEHKKSISQAQVSEADVAAGPSVQPSLKSCSILKSNVPRNKRKRRKKSSSKSWNPRSFD